MNEIKKISKIDLMFENVKNKKSDINQHMETLKKYSKECEQITEFGIRSGRSTIALLAGRPKKLTSYDINLKKFLNRDKYLNACKKEKIQFIIIEGDTLKIKIDETDLLFIDTFHIYKQLKKELKLHSERVKKYIILHDTHTFGFKGEDGSNKGLMDAVEEFLEKNKNWKLKEHFKNNNGLTILERN